MGLMDKIKNILFEEETVEIPIITNEEVEKKEEPKIREEKKEVITPKEEPVIPREERKDDFRVNKRFSAPLPEERNYRKDLYSEEPREFRRVEEKKEEPKVREVKKEVSSPFLSFDEDEFELMSSSYHAPRREEKKVSKRDAILYSKTVPEKEEVKKFKPSPIISPVYGILDKNYRKDDFLPTSSSEGTLPKIMDVDSVRKKAFGTLEEEIENKLKEKQKEEKKLEDKTIGDLIKENLESKSIEEEEIPHYNTEEIKITSFLDDDDNSSIDDAIDNNIDVEETEEVSLKEPDKEEVITKEIPVEEPKLEEEKEEPEEEMNAEDLGNTTLESDLFDLIDSMYEKEEE